MGGSPDTMVWVLSKKGIREVPLHVLESMDASNRVAVKSTQFVEHSSSWSMGGKSTDFVPDELYEGPSRRASADWTLDAIEVERVRGLEIVNHLAQ